MTAPFVHIVAEDGKAHPAYQFRTEDCPDCDRATDIRCDTCWSSGAVDAACCVCNRVTALDEDGYCQACGDEPVGWLKAETCLKMEVRK